MEQEKKEERAVSSARPSPERESASPKTAARPDMGRLDRMVGYLEEEIKARGKELRELKALIQHTRASLPPAPDVDRPSEQDSARRVPWWLKWRWHPPK